MTSVDTKPAALDSGLDLSPPIVLLANDQEWSARSLESVLGPHGFASVRAFTGRQTLELARRTQPDVIIVDAGMPDMSGVELCRLLRDDLDLPASTPLIVTTAGAVSRAERLEAHRSGAWEYLSLPVDADALILRLRLYVRAKREIDRSREESLLDGVTGLYNVRGLTRRASEIGADAARRHAPLACVALAATPSRELEFSSSDVLEPRIAEHLADLCRRSARSSDAVGRLGQSEFAIIAPGTDAEGAVRLAERLRGTVEAAEVLHDGVPRRFRVRAGYYAVADFSTSAIDAVEVLLRAATALRHVRTTLPTLGISAYEDVAARLVQ